MEKKITLSDNMLNELENMINNIDILFEKYNITEDDRQIFRDVIINNKLDLSEIEEFINLF